MSFEILLVPADRGPARIGGEPDLPDSMAWPVHRWPLAEVATWPDYAQVDLAEAREKRTAWDDGEFLIMPIPFLAQIDLAALAHGDARLPQHGVLLFFAATMTDTPDPLFAKRVASAVIFVEQPSSARKHPPTADPRPGAERYLSALRVDEPRRDAHAFLPATNDELNGPMPPTGEVALLRLAEDPDAEMYIGDASWITFAIPEAALRERRFEAARASIFIG